MAALTAEMLRNLGSLLGQCGGLALADVLGLRLKTYVRHGEDTATIRHAPAALRPGAEIMFVEADICRAALLVEIEAFCELPWSLSRRGGETAVRSPRRCP